ncbi:MAG TPA: 23S rRNA (uracil(1939)-C(5))-methyltransferase RlmD [Candidatus Sulfopaludibacter sp.]|nr:23S rRNA (uracil(1939)-C(5))-methyltransferase RlmD [Candidatus Sulfopaludibacter sp.]
MKRRGSPADSPSHPRSQNRDLGHPGSSVLVQIEKPIFGGNFLARDEGKAVFVPLVLPGEQARVRIVEEKRGYATAEADEVVVSSPERIAARCPHFGPCGGCQYQHAGYETQLGMKQDVLRETLRRGGVEPPENIDVLSGEPWAYRNRIRLAFDTQGSPGYRGRRSHAVVPIGECPIAAPLLVRAALAAAGVVQSLAPPLRPTEIALFCTADEAALLLTVFISRSAKAGWDKIAIELRNRIPQLVGAELVLESNTNDPPRTIAQWGDTSLTYRAADAGYRVDHGAFFQVNRWLVDALVDRVTAGYDGLLAWDLFAGVGLFARRLVQSFAKVVAVESAPAAIAALTANLAGTTGVAASASTLGFLREHDHGQRPDLIVVDPPRTGLGPDICARIAEVAPPALVYVSCDPATLTRDLRSLLAAGFILESITLADLFPQTFHIETVVRMRHP